MTKTLALIALTLFSFAASADQCASDINQLKALVGNNGLSLTWQENIKNDPLKLRLSNGPGNLRLKLTNSKGDWADVTGVICKKSGDSYVANVANIVWGPAAPGVVKGTKIKSINLKMPYQSLLKVKVMLFSFEFSPN